MSMTITVDVGTVRVGYDLLEDAGAQEIQAALDLMLAMVRSARFRALVAASMQLKQPLERAFELEKAPSPSSLPPIPDDAPSPSQAPSEPSPSEFPRSPKSPVLGDSTGVYEVVAVRRSERGELRAVSLSGKYSKFGMGIGNMLKEYCERAGLNPAVLDALQNEQAIQHKPIRVRVDAHGNVQFVDDTSAA